MTIACEAIERPVQPTLSMRTRTAVEKLPQVLGKAYDDISQYMSECGVSPVAAPFVAYYNQDMQDLDIEIGFQVALKLDGRGKVQPGAIPAGRYASCLHTGPYDQLGLAYQALATFSAEHGYQPTGISYEFYLNDPETTSPEHLQTQIMFPLHVE